MLVALILPVGYFSISYTYMTGALETEADVNAEIVSGVINANPELWRFEQMRLQDLLSQRSRFGHAETRRILDNQRTLIAESVNALAPPVVTRSFEILDAGVPVGVIEISRSLLPILTNTGIVGLLGLSVGAILFLLLWKLGFKGMVSAEQLRLDEVIRESESRLKLIFEASNSGIILMTPQGKIKYANSRMAELLGLTLQELINTSYIDHLHDSQKTEATARMASLESGESPISITERLYSRKDGSVFWGYLSARMLENPDGNTRDIVVIITDITENKENEKSLQEQERKFRAVFDQNFHFSGLLDLDGRITEINNTALNFIGAKPFEVLGKEFWNTPWWQHSPGLQEKIHRAIQDAVNGKYVHFEVTHPDSDGNLHYIDFSIRPVTDESGKVIFLVPEGADITMRKKSEEDQLHLERQLLHSQKLESLGVLSGGIAHDFNNLLQAIIGNLDLALSRLPDDSNARQNIVHAVNASQHAAKLTNMMLAYSGKGTFVINPLSLTELVQENAAMLSASIPKNVSLNLQFENYLPLIMADAGQLQQVVMNLITNASEAIGEENGSITLSTGVGEFDKPTLDRSRLEEKLAPGRYVWIESSDTGCGMDEVTMQKIFDPFFTTKFTGRGLGMSAVLGIIRAHKGAFLVESTPGAGSSMRVLFPIADTAYIEKVLAPFATKETVESSGCSTGNILIVDDEDMIREVCRDMLAEFGYVTLVASSGAEALGIIRNQTEKIDLVILDQSMPQMDGVTVFRELRRISPNIKVLLSSGYSEQEVSERFKGLGLDGFIQKPFNLTNLVDKVRRVLK